MCAEEIVARLLADLASVKKILEKYESTGKAGMEIKRRYEYLFSLLENGASQLCASMPQLFERGAFEAYSDAYGNYLKTIELYKELVGEWEALARNDDE